MGGVALVAAFTLASPVAAQRWDDRDWEWSGNYSRLSRLSAGTFITVRTNERISSRDADGRVYTGTVVEDVWDDLRRLSVPAIPRGSRVEMVVRTARDGDLILDLDSVFAHGQRYAVSTSAERIDSNVRRGDDRTAEFLGGGALLGSIIGAVTGGGKGAAIGAGAGAAAGAGLGYAYRGGSVRLPPGAVLTFRLDRPLAMGVGDAGYRQGRWHYHRYPTDEPQRP